MDAGSIYAVTAVVCALQIIMTLNRTRRTEYRESIDEAFCGMLKIFVLFCTVDAVWGLFEAVPFGGSRTGFLISAYGFHIMAAGSALAGVKYGMLNLKSAGKERHTMGCISFGLFAVQTLILVWNLFSHNAFWVDAEGNYFTGPLRSALYGIQMLYYLVLAGYALYRWKKDSSEKKNCINVLFFTAVLFVFGVTQYIFYDVALYSMGFTFAAFVLYTYKVTVQREFFLKERMSSMDRMQSSIIHGLAGKFVAIYYVDMDTEEFDIYRKTQEGGLIKDKKKSKDYFQMALENGERIVLYEDLAEFRQKFSKAVIEQELQEKNMYSITVRIMELGEPRYYQYRFVRPIAEEEKDKLIVGVYNVDEEIRSERDRQEQIRLGIERERLLNEKAVRLSKDVYVDAMTGLYNRRAYEEDLNSYTEQAPGEDFVYFSIDLNGLKVVNDGMGHEAGDELLKGAAFCLITSFGSYGKIYRIGGDEFVAMISAGGDKLYEIITDFEQYVLSWTGDLVKELTVSYGFVPKRERPGMPVKEIAKLADRRMYQDKEDFYANRGIDRRGQQEAYSAICSSYIKILKVNLTTDRFSIIQMDAGEKEKEKGFKDNISSWLREFALSGLVHEEDRQNYLDHTGQEFLRDFFRKGNQYFCIYYRRLIDGEFCNAMMEMIPAKEYTDEEQIVFLYVKKIGR